MKKEKEIFVKAVDIIRTRFPNLDSELILEHPNVDAELNILPQAGLKFGISINLQDDELFLSTKSLSASWFPCWNQQKFDEFISAVDGLISGTYRIVEYSIGRFVGKSELQLNKENQWIKIAVSYSPIFILHLFHKKNIYQNI
ncbi:MAG: hypothetical protein WDA22_17305 [Bacteroidota bacterium]